ncbi:MAG: acyl-CoA dehydrogenase family protein, partial [Myxococcota bacterium]
MQLSAPDVASLPSSPSPSGPLARAEAMRAALRARSREFEEARRVPADVAEELASAGIYRMLVPAEAGGLELTPGDFVRTLVELARGDAAVAWVAMTGATTGLCTAYLDDAGRRSVARDPAARFAGVFAPMGRARAVDGGYRLTGRWSFTSGCENATWILGGALVDEGEGPLHRAFFLPRDAVTVHETWDVAGLLGTGSHDTSVDDVFVPASRVCALVGATAEVPGPLYAFPVFALLAAGVAAVALGIAEAALADAAEGAGRRAKREVFQLAYGRA